MSSKIESSPGFLPLRCPELPELYRIWEEAANMIPVLIENRKLRCEIETWDHINLDPLQLPSEIVKRIYSILSILANGYIWCDTPVDSLPPQLSRPLLKVSEHLAITPCLTHASVDLYNWGLRDPDGGMGYDNLKSLVTLTGTKDEEWFYLSMVAIEAVGAPLVSQIRDGISDDTQFLRDLTTALESMQNIIHRLRENCDPDFFYNKLRIYLQGWKSISIDGKFHTYTGGSAAQSSLFQLFDAVLGIEHTDHQKLFLNEMRKYMPANDRNLIEKISQDVSLRLKSNSEYKVCVEALVKFRQAHMAVVHRYIITLSEKVKGSTIGTGGTQPTVVLKQIIEETKANLKS
jgi:indoleamine 2,3-dioxygenase